MRFVRDNLWSFLLTSLVFLVLACGGGSCGGCEGCGVAPIPGGYPIADRVDNSAQVRLTDDGIAFIEANIDTLVASFLPDGLSFNVPRTTQSFAGVNFTICSSDDCYVQGNIDNLDLTPTAPNRLNAHLRLTLDSRDSAGGRRAWPGTCDIDLDTRRGSRPYVGVVANIDFAAETEAARLGYTAVDVASVGLASGEDIEPEDIRISGGFLGSCALLDFNFIKNLIIDQLTSQVDSLLQDTINDQLCTTQGEFGCPTGTVADGSGPDAVCRYTAGGECVPQLLGTDGQGDLGQAFLGSVSPGTHAPGQFLLAAGGDGEAVNGGMSLFFYGGYRSTDLTFMTSPAHNPCVPVIDPPPMPTIPRADTFRGNTIPGGGSAHVGIGLSESFLNHAGYGMFDSGLLCIGAGTRLSQQLSTGLLSALITSLRGVTFPDTNAPVAIALRPQTPPTFEVGAGTDTDPLLTVALNGVQVDFYVWSTERYIRFMTYQADLGIPINLAVADGEIVPEIVAVNATNSVVTNSELLSEDPMLLATLIQTVISEFAAMATGGLSPFALPDLMGLALEVPDGGVTGVEDAGEEFVGIFANLAVASTAMPYSATVDTRATIDPIQIDPRALDLATFGEGEHPWVRVVADADGPSGLSYEFSWRVNGKAWSPWTTERVLEIQDSAFMLQARHELEVRARVVDSPLSVDPTPAYFEVLVDVLPPLVQADRSGRGVHITASDVLTATEDLELRYRIAGEGWTDWQTLPSEAFVPLPYDDADIEVEVRDEAGNVGGASAALIRGIPNPEGDSGCGCSTFESRTSPFAGLAFLMAFGAFLLRRRSGARPVRKAKRGKGIAKWLSILVLFSIVGCDCGGGDDPDGGTDGMVTTCDMCVAAVPPATVGGICCEMSDTCIAYDLIELCDPGFQCSSGDQVAVDESCNVSCNDCVRSPALEPGLLATYLDMHVNDDGSAVISGYSPGDAPARLYGDLVIGTAPPGPGESVQWEIVDGAPDMPITNDPDGYRGGVAAPGPDVGRWTSIAESGGVYYVSYYDRDAGALKLAYGAPAAWTVITVDDTGDSGRYSSIAITASGSPAIAYLQIARDAGSAQVMSRVKVAIADDGSPMGPPDWLSTEIAAGVMACRPAFCDAAETCIEAGTCVTDTGDCASACASGEVCVAGACETALPDNYVEDMPPAVGLYNSLVATASGLALVYYDRGNGNLWGTSNDGSSWAAPFLIDGYGAGTLGVGDSGMAASLFVDAAGVWHVSYVDGAEENLRYARIEGSTVTKETVDNGATDGSASNPDGRHIVGDDSSIVVTEGGEIRIAYQDATSRRAMLARRPASGGEWAISIFDEADSTGFWIEQQLLGATSVIATYYRSTDTGGTRLFNVD